MSKTRGTAVGERHYFLKCHRAGNVTHGVAVVRYLAPDTGRHLPVDRGKVEAKDDKDCHPFFSSHFSVSVLLLLLVKGVLELTLRA